MADKFQYRNAELNSPGDVFYTIIPSDAADIPIKPRAVIVGVSGNLAVIDSLGVTTTIPNVIAGIFHPIRPMRVLATGTTATGIVGIC